MRRPLTLALVLVALTGCVRHTQSTGQQPTPEGPPAIQYDIVQKHATQFDVDFPDRLPGSQQELAAASYILGHLQLAGYSPRLDRVPVGDVVNSTNVVAMPPDGSKPEVLVTVVYDTDGSGSRNGDQIGLFLEVARALSVADANHHVGFVALGAESSEGRGSRRLAQFLVDQELDPVIYSLGAAPPRGEDALVFAGFSHRFLDGNVREVGATLMTELTGRES